MNIRLKILLFKIEFIYSERLHPHEIESVIPPVINVSTGHLNKMFALILILLILHIFELRTLLMYVT